MYHSTGGGRGMTLKSLKGSYSKKSDAVNRLGTKKLSSVVEELS